MDEIGYLKQVRQFQQLGTFFLTLFFIISILLLLVALLMKIYFIGWLSLHIFIIAFNIFVHYGFGLEWLWKDAMVFNYQLGVFSVHIVSLTILLYLKPFLFLKGYWKKAYSGFIGLAIILTLLACWMPYDHFILKAIENIIFIALLAVLAFIFPTTLRKRPQTVWIFLGCISLCITYFLGDSWYQGMGLISGLGDYWIFWGQTIEILFLSIGAILIISKMRQDQQKSIYLQALNATKSRFFTNISHELKTPLTLVLAPLENALGLTQNQSLRENLKLAQSNSQKLLKLVNEILDLSKLENNKLKLHQKEVQLMKLINRLFFAFKLLATSKNIQLKLAYQLPTNLWVKIDIEKFEKILDNLISNALKFSNNGGIVTLGVLSKGKEQFLITIHNTGKGIALADLPQIFNRYYQGQTATATFQKGTGIGLALAKELTRLFKGQLTVSSQPKEGTTFYLILPLEEVVPKTKKLATAEIVELKSPTMVGNTLSQTLFQDKPKILIVEDHREMSRFLVRILSPHYHCTTARDGLVALQKLEQERFDLITSDVMMPKMDGFTLLKKIHEREVFCHTPVIMLTAQYLEADKLQGFQLGVDDYITKPFSTQELIARIENLLQNKQERTNWQQMQNTNVLEKNDLPPTAEQGLLQKAKTLVFQNLSNTKYRVGDLAKEMHYSQRQLERIIKKLTGLSPVNFIKEIRLQKARQLLENRQFTNVSEVGFEVGFMDSGYFSKVYQKRFGKRPSEVD